MATSHIELLRTRLQYDGEIIGRIDDEYQAVLAQLERERAAMCRVLLATGMTVGMVDSVMAEITASGESK